MALYLNLEAGDGFSADGPVKVIFEKREGGKGARVRIDADKSVTIEQHRAPRAAAALAASGIGGQVSKAR
jgi:hypothetical protein